MIQESIDKISIRLADHRQSQVYILNNSPKDIVNVINIAINLLELAERGFAKLLDGDRKYFSGAYHVSRNFDTPERGDISILCNEIADYANGKYFK